MKTTIEAIAREEAQSTEPYAWSRLLRDGKNSQPVTVFKKPDDAENWVELFTHPAPAKQPLDSERAELIESHRWLSEHGVNTDVKTLARKTADMLAADAERIAGYEITVKCYQAQVDDISAPRVPMTMDQIDDLKDDGVFLRSPYEIVDEIETFHKIGEVKT